MAIRLYTVVVDCQDVSAQGHWWAQALGWSVVHEAPDEVGIEALHTAADGGSTPVPGLVFVPVAEGKTVKNRLHLDLAAPAGDDQGVEVDRLLALGATRVDVGQQDVSWVVLADPEGNEFCVLSSRD